MRFENVVCAAAWQEAKAAQLVALDRQPEVVLAAQNALAAPQKSPSRDRHG
jgi:hypothetical protein